MAFSVQSLSQGSRLPRRTESRSTYSPSRQAWRPVGPAEASTHRNLEHKVMPYNNQAIPPTPEPLGAATLPCTFRILLDYDLSA